MLRVNIVVTPPDLSWIGGRFASELMTWLPKYGVEAMVNGKSENADLEYQQIVYGPPTFRPAVGLFTHGEDRPRRFAREYDGHITFSSTLRDCLLDAGAHCPLVIDYPVDPRFRLGRPLVFGVAGRTYSDGRKGEHLVAAMVRERYQVIAWGDGWPCPIVGSDLSQLRDFYGMIDYYIDTSSDEGGCVPAAEAQAMGVPVVSHTVGVTRPVIPYERHSWESLREVLRRLTTPYTYERFAQDHAKAFFDAIERADEAIP